jgi:hypothetical protein
MWWAQLLNSVVAFLEGGAGGAAGSYESIATVTAAGGESSISFTSIPSTYVSIQVRGISRRSTGINHSVLIRLNNDTSANYTRHGLDGNGSTVTATGNTGMTFMNWFSGNGGTNLANQFGAGIMDLHDYASTTKNKTVRAWGGFDANGSGVVSLYSGLWLSTAAVNSVTLFFGGDAVAAGSTFSLYGIKGA